MDTGCQPAQCFLRSLLVVFTPPGFDDSLGMRQVQESVPIQTFIAQPPVERLDVGILIRFTRLNQAQRHVTGLRPGQHGADVPPP